MIDNFKVTPGKVLVKEIPFDRVTKGGLFVPDNSNYRTIKGEVISIGHDKYIPEGELSIGTTILYGAHAGTKIKIDRVVYILLNTVDVYASQINGKLKVLASPSIIVEVDKMYKDHVKMGNVDLFVDPLYNRTHNVKYCGTVVSIPNFEPYDDVDDTRKIDPIIQVGDKVYFKYLATDDDRHLMFKDINDHSEKMTIRVFYPWVFCVVRNDEIIPVVGWCIGEPVIEGVGHGRNDHRLRRIHKNVSIHQEFQVDKKHIL